MQKFFYILRLHLVYPQMGTAAKNFIQFKLCQFCIGFEILVKSSLVNRFIEMLNFGVERNSDYYSRST